MSRILRGLPTFAMAPVRPLPVTRILAHPSWHSPKTRTPFFQSFTTSRVRLLSNTSKPNLPSPRRSLPEHEAPKSLSERLKHLIKTYGWYALGVHIVLSTLDFGVAFAAINLLGAEYVSDTAAHIKSFVYQLIGREVPETLNELPGLPGYHHGGGSEGLYAMIGLAFTIHKTLFFPIRVGLTAAITPKFVNWLMRRGWIGAGRRT